MRMKAAGKPATREKAKRSLESPTLSVGSKGHSRTKLDLDLYIADDTPRSRLAVSNLERICEKHLPGQCRIRVVDLEQNPQLACQEQIIAIPTLVRKWPQPIKKVLGDLSNVELVLAALGVKTA